MSPTRKPPTFFSKVKPTEFVIGSLHSDLNTAVSDLDVSDEQLTNGQNIIPASDTSLKKRNGISLFGPLLGNLGVTSGFNFVSQAGVQRQLVVYNTGVNIHTATTSTPISGLTMTQGVQCDGVYFDFTDKFYITNGTDTVAKVLNDGTGNQSDTNFKKGKYITAFMNRLLVANTSSNPNRVWYTDSQADTFTNATQWFDVSGAITGIKTFYSKVLIFTKRKIYRLENFTFDGTNSWASQLFELPIEFGSIVEGTIQVVDNYIFFLGQDMNNVAAIYQCDGYTAQNITDTKIKNTVAGLSGSQLNNAFAISDDMTYRLYVAESGQGTNNIGLVYDCIRNYFYPVERRWLPNVADISCLWSSETNGVWSVYAGTQTNGQVYQLHSNDGLYDELAEEKDLVTGGASYPVEEVLDLRVGQSFKMTQYSSTNMSVPITQVAIQAKTNAGTPGNLVVRIETDNNGLPSGTLVNANATTTIASSLGSSTYKYLMGIFPAPFNLIGNTPYWIVVMCPAGTQNSKWLLSAENGGTYASGNLATYQSVVSTVTNSYQPDNNKMVAGLSYSIDGSTFSSLRSAASANAIYNPPTAYLACSSISNTFAQMIRSVNMFDTSLLPSGATISSAKIRLFVTDAPDLLSQKLNFTSVSTASNTQLFTTDYTVANFGSTRFITDVSPTSLTINAYNDFVLNASGIANIVKAGISKFAGRLSGDIDNVAPTWLSARYSGVNYQNFGQANPPLLVVTYSVAGGASTWVSIPATDLNFAVYSQSPIDAFADSKAYLPVDGKEFKLIKFQAIFSQIGSYYAEIGFEASTIPGIFTTYLVNLSSSGGSGKWDDNVSKWDDGLTIWDGTPSRSLAWTDIGSYVSRISKMRVRNRNANQQFEFNRLNLQILPRLRNV